VQPGTGLKCCRRADDEECFWPAPDYAGAQLPQNNTKIGSAAMNSFARFAPILETLRTAALS